MIEESDIDKLHQFVIYSDLATFKKIFGDTLGEHFWIKFQGDFDLLRLWGNLDKAHRVELVKGINEFEP